MPHRRGQASDRKLVERCLAGDRAAWDCLIRHNEPQLLTRTRQLLGKEPMHQQWAEEIVQQLWDRLFCNPHRLCRYDPDRGTLPAFLAVQASYQVQLHRRRTRQPKMRMVSLGDQEPLDPSADLGITSAQWEEWLAALSERDRTFLREQVLNPSRAGPRSPADRKRLERLRKKWRDYFFRP